MITPADVAEFLAKIELDIIALQSKMVAMDERLCFYENRVTQNRLMIEDNRSDIDKLKEKCTDGIKDIK